MNIFVFISVDTHQPTALCVIRKAWTVTMHQLCPLPGLQFAHQFNWEFLIACRWVWMVVCVSVRPLRWTGILSRLQLCLRPKTAGIGCGDPECRKWRFPPSTSVVSSWLCISFPRVFLLLLCFISLIGCTCSLFSPSDSSGILDFVQCFAPFCRHDNAPSYETCVFFLNSFWICLHFLYLLVLFSLCKLLLGLQTPHAQMYSHTVWIRSKISRLGWKDLIISSSFHRLCYSSRLNGSRLFRLFVLVPHSWLFFFFRH